MNRLASALSLALMFSLVSCGDDEKSTVDAGTDASTASDGGGATACTGSFAGINSTQLAGAIAMSSGPKSCQNDVALVCTANIAGIAGQCGLGCVGNADPRTCSLTCIKGQLPTLSDPCSGCYVDTVLCAQMKCLQPCLAGTSSAGCVQCQIDQGCRSAFATCSGLPVGPTPDGGAAGDGGGATDGGAADAPAGDGGAVDAAAGDGATDSAAATDTAAAADMAASTDTTTD